jgi:hypothetical protein
MSKTFFFSRFLFCQSHSRFPEIARRVTIEFNERRFCGRCSFMAALFEVSKKVSFFVDNFYFSFFQMVFRGESDGGDL